MSEVEQAEVVGADVTSEPAPPSSRQLTMRVRHLPYLQQAHADRAQVLRGPVGVHANLSKEDKEKLVDTYFPRDLRNNLLLSQKSILPEKFTREQVQIELENAFVATYNVISEGTAFGPKSALSARAKMLGGVGGRSFLPFETEQFPNDPKDAVLDLMIQAGNAEKASAREIKVKEAAEAVKLFRLTVFQVSLSLLLDPLPATEWVEAKRKVYVFPRSAFKSTIGPLLSSFESSKSQVGTEGNLTFAKLQEALEVVCENKSRVPQEHAKLATLVRDPLDNLRTWCHRVKNAAQALQAELSTDFVMNEYPNAETGLPRVLWFILMKHQTSRAERAFIKKVIEDKSKEGKQVRADFSFEPWKDEESWKSFLEAFKGPSFEALKGPTKADRKEITDHLPVFPGEMAKRRKTEGGRQPGGASRSESATANYGQQARPQSGKGKRGKIKPVTYTLKPGQSYAHSAVSKISLSEADLKICKELIESATQPVLQEDGRVAHDVSPPCEICKKYFFNVKAGSAGFLPDTHPTYKCRMVKINSKGEAYKTASLHKKIPKRQ